LSSRREFALLIERGFRLSELDAMDADEIVSWLETVVEVEKERTETIKQRWTPLVILSEAKNLACSRTRQRRT
jgi:hypothetical protein